RWPAFQIPPLAGEKSMKRLRRINPVFFAISFALGSTLNSAVAGQFKTIDVPGAIQTQTLGINTAGDIVGDYTDSIFGVHGFLLSHDTFTILDKRVFSPSGI